MNKEFDLLYEIKSAFGWPVDTQRYGLQGAKRFWDGRAFSDSLSSEVRERVRFSLQKVKIAEKKLKILTKLPWVEMIFITGSVASLNAKEDDDIDIWLVVKPRRIWLTRALDFLLFAATGSRRLSRDGVIAARVQNKFCFNFYTTTKEMELSRHSISYAMQFADAIPIFVRDNRTQLSLHQANSWVSEYFPSWYARKLKTYTVEELNKQDNRGEIALLTPFLDLLEYVAGFLMLLKAEKRVTFSPTEIYRSRFTTWGTPRILSRYDNETITESGQEGK